MQRCTWLSVVAAFSCEPVKMVSLGGIGIAIERFLEVEDRIGWCHFERLEQHLFSSCCRVKTTSQHQVSLSDDAMLAYSSAGLLLYRERPSVSSTKLAVIYSV
jgi:hypothetical protein